VQFPRDATVGSPTGDPAPASDEKRPGAAREELAATEQKLHEAEARAGTEYVRAERLASDLRTLNDEARKHRDRASRHAKELEDERRARQKLEADIAHARRPPEPPPRDQTERVLALEAELIEARTQLATPRVPAVDVTKLVLERDRLTSELTAAQRALIDRDREHDAALARGKALESRIGEHVAAASAHERSNREAREHDARVRARMAEVESIAARAELEVAQVVATHERDVADLELALRACGEEVRAARVELGRRGAHDPRARCTGR